MGSACTCINPYCSTVRSPVDVRFQSKRSNLGATPGNKLHPPCSPVLLTSTPRPSFVHRMLQDTEVSSHHGRLALQTRQYITCTAKETVQHYSDTARQVCCTDAKHVGAQMCAAGSKEDEVFGAAPPCTDFYTDDQGVAVLAQDTYQP